MRPLLQTCGVIAVLIAALALAACGDELGECPPNSLNQQQLGSNILNQTCIGCHFSQLTGAERAGAPVGMDFDDPDVVRDLEVRIYETALDGSMPPDSGLNEAQIESLRVYLACGAEL